ncbi:DNA-binding response regulator [Paracoccus aestuariivivens]|uniref:DNA-binding response regulator n=1 Tax=Paracoccus aestuariivivens TaxID=1820333 RepID=A0A6L6JHV3_9RHOB|nr:DNA-binding response regulator [Paracoccus aestuariivivens]MTH80137.1 DNA-binding response regulator [Paracoccus aestuariivivens]
MIKPLMKRRPDDGRLYERRPEVTALLLDLEVLPRGELIRRAQVTLKSDPDFIPSECLLHFVRRSKRENPDRLFETLFRALIARVEYAATLRGGQHYLPDGSRGFSRYAIDVRDYVMDRFLKRLMDDRSGYDSGLDYYEVNFAHAVASLRSTAKRSVIAKADRLQPLSTNDDEAVSVEVERAAGAFDPLDRSRFDDGNYRSRLASAIMKLPIKERQVVVLLLKEYPIESNDPNKPDICTTLSCVEKTVRNRRDRAFAKLRVVLLEEEIDV